MNERQRKKMSERERQKRAAAIADRYAGGNKTEAQPEFRQDGGYSNMLNKYGTKQDNSTGYIYRPDGYTDDMQLAILYEGNGLFAKIIDRPAEEAMKRGFDIDYGDQDITEYVEARMDALNLEDAFVTAEQWARLYGGAIIVMLVDDGRGLEEPLDWQNAKSIEELRVFERSVVQPDYTTLGTFHFEDSMKNRERLGKPETYVVSSIYGYFRVHRSRCLIFRNGKAPEQTSSEDYRYWGIPEYARLKRALRECITSHQDGTKLLERSAQGIYKMKNLANMLSTADGEDKVLNRLQVIDLARNILNSIAIDVEGEDYDFKSLSMAGVKDVLDSTCNMLSAVTDIPQTILFGRSPAGLNSTGDSDMENYYNMVERIQKRNMKRNARIVIDLILQQGYLEGEIPEIPKYKVKFASLRSLTEKEQAATDQQRAATDLAKAQTMQLYIVNGVLDPSEVRKKLADDGSFEIDEILNGLDTDDDLDVPEEMIRILEQAADSRKDEEQSGETIRIAGESQEDHSETINIEPVYSQGAAVLVVHDGKILCAERSNGEGICGPGGKVEPGETPEQAAIREAQEEFGITPLKLMPLGRIAGCTGKYLPATMYWTDQYIGEPAADEDEMHNARWLSMKELSDKTLFEPFRESIERLLSMLTGESDIDMIFLNADGGKGSGNWGHKGRSGKRGGSGGGGEESLPMTDIEKAKVAHDINNIYHARYKGKKNCYIRTSSNEPDSPSFFYRFKNHGFNDYDIYHKTMED